MLHDWSRRLSGPWEWGSLAVLAFGKRTRGEIIMNGWHRGGASRIYALEVTSGEILSLINGHILHHNAPAGAVITDL
jgi:hypothetical protein